MWLKGTSAVAVASEFLARHKMERASVCSIEEEIKINNAALCCKILRAQPTPDSLSTQQQKYDGQSAEKW
jgi:hypothetical protein